jgi:hypothetical protein
MRFLSLTHAQAADPRAKQSEGKTLEFKGNGLSTQQIANAISRSTRATRTRLAGLVRRGLIIEIGSGLRDPRRKYYPAKRR